MKAYSRMHLNYEKRIFSRHRIVIRFANSMEIGAKINSVGNGNLKNGN